MPTVKKFGEQSRCKASNSSESKLQKSGTNQAMQQIAFEEERKKGIQ